MKRTGIFFASLALISCQAGLQGNDPKPAGNGSPSAEVTSAPTQRPVALVSSDAALPSLPPPPSPSGINGPQSLPPIVLATPTPDLDIGLRPSSSPTPMPQAPSPMPSRPPNLAQGLIAHYAFEGNLKSQDGLHDATDPSTRAFKYTSNGITGQAALFSPGLESTPEGYIFGKTGFDFKFAFTFSVWVYLLPDQSVTASWAILASRGIKPLPYAFYWTPGGAEVVLNKGTTNELWSRRVKSPRQEIQQTEVWQHWVATYDGHFVKVYLNGHLDFEQAYNEPIIHTPYSEDVYIGRCDGLGEGNDDFHFNGYLTTFQGTMDELRIYNRALSPEEVQQLYQFK